MMKCSHRIVSFWTIVLLFCSNTAEPAASGSITAVDTSTGLQNQRRSLPTLSARSGPRDPASDSISVSQQPNPKRPPSRQSSSVHGPKRPTAPSSLLPAAKRQRTGQATSPFFLTPKQQTRTQLHKDPAFEKLFLHNSRTQPTISMHGPETSKLVTTPPAVASRLGLSNRRIPTMPERVVMPSRRARTAAAEQNIQSESPQSLTASSISGAREDSQPGNLGDQGITSQRATMGDRDQTSRSSQRLPGMGHGGPLA